jgi:hypothetical protein
MQVTALVIPHVAGSEHEVVAPEDAARVAQHFCVPVHAGQLEAPPLLLFPPPLPPPLALVLPPPLEEPPPLLPPEPPFPASFAPLLPALLSPFPQATAKAIATEVTKKDSIVFMGGP